MAKKKKEVEKEEEIEKVNDFNLQECFKEVNPFLLYGLKKYIFENNIKITTKKEFREVYEKYGGF